MIDRSELASKLAESEQRASALRRELDAVRKRGDRLARAAEAICDLIGNAKSTTDIQFGEAVARYGNCRDAVREWNVAAAEARQ